MRKNVCADFEIKRNRIEKWIANKHNGEHESAFHGAIKLPPIKWGISVKSLRRSISQTAGQTDKQTDRWTEN